MADEPKPIVWIGTSRRELKTFPKRVRSDIGQALYTAQLGETDPAAKPLKGFGGALVMEIVDRTIPIPIVLSTLCNFPM